MKLCEIVQALTDVRMLGPQRFLPNDQGPLIEWFCVFEVAPLTIITCEVG
jgi:hypothetical protein